ncbi:hypothetical protein CesoFtcFv8_017639 [Champsocephalus esox]|uniref:Uncharacterized protein n=1 Tax=Champsocephalus esox TaxID=159716 RepID=A0AAN8BJV8_9TELE|nr:hypothetical protein CesoFtcFv8_017639 [Champsocephalus esox]
MIDWSAVSILAPSVFSLFGDLTPEDLSSPARAKFLSLYKWLCVDDLYLFVTVSVFFRFRILLDGGGPLRPWSLSLCELRWLVTCLRGQKPLLQNTQHEGNSRRRAEQPDSVDDDIFKHPPPTHCRHTQRSTADFNI